MSERAMVWGLVVLAVATMVWFVVWAYFRVEHVRDLGWL